MDDFQREHRDPKGNEAYAGTPPSNRQTAGGQGRQPNIIEPHYIFIKIPHPALICPRENAFFAPPFSCLCRRLQYCHLCPHNGVLNGATSSSLNQAGPDTGKLIFQDLPPWPFKKNGVPNLARHYNRYRRYTMSIMKL